MILKTLNIIYMVFALLSFSQSAVKNDSTLNAARLGAVTEPVIITDYSKVFYVAAQKGSDKKGNGSRENPWQTISHALWQIPEVPPGRQYAIWVAEGIYDQGTVIMKEYVALYGGFDSQFEKRDIYTHPTILDGQSLRRVVVAADNAILDGFTIRNGLSRGHGAGILCHDTSPRISNNFITDNLVLEPAGFDPSHIHQEGNNGGGIACLYNAVPVIRNNIFYDNKTSVGTGAAISFYGWVRHKDGPQMTVINNRLSGGLQARVENNVIVNNTSGLNDLQRTRSSSGGGISCAFEARPIIRNNLVAMNRAMGRSDAGGIYCEYFSDPLINGNWILGNIADDDGGGFYTMKLGMPLLSNNFFAGNYTTGGGVGAIRLSKEGRARIVDNIVVYNPGGGVMCVDAYMELEGNIIMHNPAGSGLKYVMNFSYFNPAVVRNNIIERNEEDEIAVLENVGHKLQIEKDNNISVPLTGDVVSGNIVSLKFDPVHYVTHMTTDKDLATDMNLAGRVIQAAGQWTLISTVEGKKITIWGKITQKDTDFKIISTFMEQ